MQYYLKMLNCVSHPPQVHDKTKLSTELHIMQYRIKYGMQY